MQKRTSTINRDMGTKKECIADLRRAIMEASLCLDGKALHTALYILEKACQDVTKKLPKEKITKPFKA